MKYKIRFLIASIDSYNAGIPTVSCYYVNRPMNPLKVCMEDYYFDTPHMLRIRLGVPRDLALLLYPHVPYQRGLLRTGQLKSSVQRSTLLEWGLSEGIR